MEPYLTYQERSTRARAQTKAWREKNKERWQEINRAYAKKWAAENPERKQAIRKREYQKNRDAYLKRAKAWREANPERHKENMRRAEERRKARALAPRCISCESIITETGISMCAWCVKTYGWNEPRKCPNSSIFATSSGSLAPMSVSFE